MTRRLRILALEPYYGGSHQAVLDGLVRGIDAEWTVLTLPARKWKWRMRGAAITMAADAQAMTERSETGFDLIFASTFVNLAEFRGLAGPRMATVPAVVYFHENQLAYPNRHTAEWDFQFPLTNITSALAAERCIFNSRWNLDSFVGSIPGFLREFPDHQPQGVAERIAAKSVVLAPPFEPDVFDRAPVVRGPRCRIVWPHRWEHDKNPEAFFSVMRTLADEGLDFEVVVAGQAFHETSDLMRESALALGERLVQCAEPATRDEYAAILASADVAVSTADNEFFGVAMMEACYAGCTPVVPDRLAYTELYPADYRYSDLAECTQVIREHIAHRPVRGSARPIAAAFTFEQLIPEYTRLLADVGGLTP